jgi:hypothetical protein
MESMTMSPQETITIPKKDLAGSRLRCLMLTSLPRGAIASALSSLVTPHAVVDPNRHHWRPKGFLDPEEAKLGECKEFLTPAIRETLTAWWLVNRRRANTPNWDLVSTCTIDGREGLILIEAKAHDTEAKREGKGTGDAGNHQQIDAAIHESNNGLLKIAPGWSISRDSHYQLSNRFAWAWKVASLGVPVVLVYVGFLDADEMKHRGRPFTSTAHWRTSMLEHGLGLVPASAWESRLDCGGAPMWALLRTMKLQWPIGT